VENVRPRGEFRMRVNIQLFITFQITPPHCPFVCMAKSSLLVLSVFDVAVQFAGKFDRFEKVLMLSYSKIAATLSLDVHQFFLK
jgi:hypothetical protein